MEYKYTEIKTRYDKYYIRWEKGFRKSTITLSKDVWPAIGGYINGFKCSNKIAEDKYNRFVTWATFVLIEDDKRTLSEWFNMSAEEYEQQKTSDKWTLVSKVD